jgi:hypothetical protein
MGGGKEREERRNEKRKVEGKEVVVEERESEGIWYIVK